MSDTHAILRKIAETTTRVSIVDAVKLGDAFLVELMVADTADTADTADAFRIACYHRRVDIVRVLIDISKNAMNDALQTASECGHAEIVRLLLDHGVDSNAITEALENAYRNGQTHIVRMLLELPAERGIGPEVLNSAFRDVCECGNIGMIELFLELPLKIDMATLEEELHNAIENRFTVIARLLLEAYRGVELGNVLNRALEKAVTCSCTEIVGAILEVVSEHETVLEGDRKYLISAIGNRDHEIVRMLLDLPSEWGIDDDELEAGFELAMRNNDEDVIRLFWRRGLLTTIRRQ